MPATDDEDTGARADERLDDIEIDLLCEGIFRHYGFDFRHYARASLKRRVRNLLQMENLESISALQDRILHNRQNMERFLLNLSINVTAMFRDPEMYSAFREQVVPILHTYPSVRIWHAGCATGEEVYSMAIVLEEEGLADKAKIYATDFNESVLKQAQTGIFPMSSMREYTENYLEAGGTESFSKYYNARYDHVIMASRLRDRIVFSRHNLVTDGSFNEFNVILCRNVLIYFNAALQDRVHRLLHDSLCRFGVLVLGTKETVEFTSQQDRYRELDAKQRIYQRVA